ncbi:MAG: mechanosensitive ion channel domain-containing protein [Pseudomonadota bacterium]
MIDWRPVIGWLLQNGTRILIISVVGITLWFALNRFLPPLIRRTVRRNIEEETEEEEIKREDTLIAVLSGIGQVLIVLIVVFSILSVLNVPIAPVLASFGIAGVAVGFGAQYLVRDLISGVFIIMENQYRVGDVARVADISGLVERITLRKTILRDLDGIVHHIPNGEIKVASNFTRNYSRVNMNISVSYGANLDHAIRVVNRVGEELAKDEKWRDIIISPPKVLRVDKLGDSGIELKILGDVKPIKQWDVMGELRLRLKNTFDIEGIEIPWPHTKVYFGDPQPQLVAGPPCPACPHVNPPGSNFCAGCGVSLVNP